MATVTETLRQMLDQSEQSRYSVSRETGIPESVLSRFVAGATLRGENIDKLADHFGMVLVAKAGRVRKRK